MTRTRLRIAAAWLAALASACAAGPGTERRGANLARGKRYRLWPRPNYRHCTDAGDRTQLTDGAYSKGYFWTQNTTVGWTNARAARITIDLGKVEPISGISYNTAAGVAGVKWPTTILLLVSDDGRTWRFVGDLVALSSKRPPPASGYAVHKYAADELAARGRFVTLLAASAGPYIFCDEVEVRRGDHRLLKTPSAGREVGSLEAFFRASQVAACVRRRLLADLSAVRKNVEAASLEARERKELLSALESIRARIAERKAPDLDRFRTVLPLGDVHRSIFAVQARLWRTMFASPIVAWQKNRWDMVNPTEAPRKGPLRLSAAMMRGERRGAAVLLTNVCGGEAEVRLRLRGLASKPQALAVGVYDVPFTDTKSGVPIAAAMPDAAQADGGGWVVRIPPGMTRQVWLSFHPKDLAAGEYGGTLLCDGRCQATGTAVSSCRIEIPLHLKVYPLTFPKRPALHLCGWDYTDRERCYNVTPVNREAFIRMLRAYHVDTPWAQRATMPAGKHDKTGKMIEPPDDGAFRTWLKRWPDARLYLVFASVGRRFAGLEIGTPAFRRAVGEWIAWWDRRAKQLGLKAGQLGVLLVDEPHSAEQDRTIIAYASVIREAAPDVIIWEDTTWRDPRKAAPRLFELCNVLCPNRPMWIAQGEAFADFYVRQREAGRELWLYSCSGPGKLLDPYAYHRLQAWHCWKIGAKGMGYWAFGDSNRASSWNEYLSIRGAYTPLFLDDRTVTRGKHMEAIAEGVQDYEYLRMLRDRIAAVEKADSADKRLPAAKKLLATAADRVLACVSDVSQLHWHREKDRGAADRVRVELLDMLVRLQGR